jgi:2-methylcitrate dehydratase PrpD
MPANKETEAPSAELASFVSNLSFEDLSTDAVTASERSITDTVGVMLVGTTTEPAQKAVTFVKSTSGSNGPGSVFASGMSAPVPGAVFANGIAAHALDFDDDQFTVYSHTSATMIPTLLTLAEMKDVSGQDIITAHVAGFETQYYLAAPINPGHYERGWHSTATFGAFGTVASVANLIGLNPVETRNALNMVASTAAGLKKNFGTMSKPFHVGHTARSGLTAALLSERGFTANSKVLDGPRGFWELYAGDNGVDKKALPDLGQPFALVEDGIYRKKYPCCYGTHRAIAAALELADKEEIEPADIDSIQVLTPEVSIDCLPYSNPSTGLEAKFSMEYCIAAALVKHKLTLETFEDEALNNQEVQSLRTRVLAETDTSLPYDGDRNTVRIKTKAGNTYEKTRSLTPGSPDDPLTETELRDKFKMCASRVLSENVVSEAYTQLNSISDKDRCDDTIQSFLLA